MTNSHSLSESVMVRVCGVGGGTHLLVPTFTPGTLEVSDGTSTIAILFVGAVITTGNGEKMESTLIGKRNSSEKDSHHSEDDTTHSALAHQQNKRKKKC